MRVPRNSFFGIAFEKMSSRTKSECGNTSTIQTTQLQTLGHLYSGHTSQVSCGGVHPALFGTTARRLLPKISVRYYIAATSFYPG